MTGVFYVAGRFTSSEDYSKLSDISALSDWETGKVQIMSYMFNNADSLTSIEPLRNWDVSSVTEMVGTFRHTINLADATAIKNWNVTNVTATAGSSSSSTNKFHQMFNESTAVLEPFILRSGTWNSSGTYVPSS